VRDGQDKIISDEVDRSGEQLVHRLLFASQREIAVVFSTISISLSPRIDREIQRARSGV
jgi:hypothetical protein